MLKISTLLFLFFCVLASNNVNAQLDPGTQRIIDNFIPYTPNPSAHYAFCALYIVLCVIFTIYTLYKRDWWALCLPIGALFEGVGFPNRVRFSKKADMGLYVSGDLFIFLAPVAYLAFNYIVFGRLSHNLVNDRSIYKSKRNLTIIPPRHIKTLFVWSDVLTFLAQTAGGLMKIDDSLVHTGDLVTLIGIIVQFVSYLLFVAIAIRCRVCCPKLRENEFGKRIDLIFWCLWFSSTFIIIRQIYRTIALGSGSGSSVNKSQVCFFVLDAAPLFLAIGIYAFVWPTNHVSLKRSDLGFENNKYKHFDYESNIAFIK